MDISEGGMLIMTERPLPFMTTLDLFLGFGDTILKVKGEVTRLEKQAGNKTLMGLRFLDLDEDARALLKVASLSALSPTGPNSASGRNEPADEEDEGEE